LILASLGQLLGGDSFAVFRSRDGGDTWTQASQGLPTFSRINAVHDDGTRVLAGTDAGLFRSDDDGGTWNRMTGGLPEEAPGIAFWVRGVRVFAAVRLPDRGIEPAKGQGAQRPTPIHPSSRR
jgi:photosystem II stability/assembly factor-like uncharacterized protein